MISCFIQTKSFAYICHTIKTVSHRPMAINSAVYEEVTKIFKAYLERKELRKTPERFAILEEIYSRTGHFDVESLFISMRDKNYRVSRATVYNTLDLLVDCFLVTKHQFGQNISQFEKSYPSRQHDHLICTDCNKVVEFCDPRLYSIQRMVEETKKFKVMHHSLTFYANCQTENCENIGKNLAVYTQRSHND
jgi:Fur family transcriptional regulator, ferric uptake regulator